MAQAPRFEPLGFGPFAKTHAAFTEVDAFDWEALASADHDPKERERGRRSFVLRALDEQRSLAAFTELLGELVEAGAPIDVIGSLARVVRDEALHVDLCDRVVKALGGWAERPVDHSAWVVSAQEALERCGSSGGRSRPTSHPLEPLAACEIRRRFW